MVASDSTTTTATAGSLTSLAPATGGSVILATVSGTITISNAFSTTAQLGVRNEEGGPEVVTIRLRAGSHDSTWTVGLKDGQEWTHEVSRPLGTTVSASVALASPLAAR